jgi:hypothetical protein
LVFGLRLIQCCQFSLPISISVGRFPASSIESAAASRSFLFGFLARAFGVRHQSDYTLSLWNLVSSVQWFWRPCPLGKSSLVFSLLFLGFPAPGLDFVTGLSFHDFSSVTRESAATYHFSVIVPGPRSRGRSSWLCHGRQVASAFWISLRWIYSSPLPGFHEQSCWPEMGSRSARARFSY